MINSKIGKNQTKKGSVSQMLSDKSLVIEERYSCRNLALTIRIENKYMLEIM
ncbi:hypothetical protein [Maledivibacter halophilus]|uniref:hypothetical protein n=1 Tax=Maledivibacter halophilus TaxID=36842 RepID=UPI001AD8A999|nr:hypothetical protein [Maledivibacter halophilus]